jgi:hypothetical protein
MKIITKALAFASLFAPSLAFAQNVTQAAAETPASSWVSPYYPLINSAYLAGTIVLIRDITIILVLWVVLFRQFEGKEKGK